jgi:flagellar hook-length control protein FliK
MQINHSGDAIRVSIVTEQIAAREILLSHVGELRTHLTEQGMRVEKIDIQFDQSFDQSMANARHESNRSNEKRQQGSRSTPGSQPAEADSEESPEPVRVREGILDLVA